MSRGVSRVNDRRVINGILWRSRTGSPLEDIPEPYGPYTACDNRFVRWRRAGVWDRLLTAVLQAFDSSFILVNQHGATQKRRAQIGAWDVPAAA